MSKIGLVTIYQVPNYGSVLQCFATQKVLEDLGHECYVINYKFPNEWHYKNGFRKGNLIKKIIYTFFPKKKTKELDYFKKTHLHYTKYYKSLEELNNEEWNIYDCFIVGSDQVWNTKYLKGDKVFLLSFLPNSIKRYSIASSFALKTLPKKYIELFKNELNKFSAISVRENNAINIIQEELSIKKDVTVILDPTLLLNKEKWRSIIKRSKFVKKRPYILFYMWTYAFEPRPYIYDVTKFFADKFKYDIIALEGYETGQHYLKMKNKSNVCIEEFIDLFLNADIVITSSFHGTAFALNFGKPLITIVPNNNEDDRQITLVKKVCENHCIAEIGQKIDTLNPFYDVNKEQMKLDKLRQASLSWIAQNIK